MVRFPALVLLVLLNTSAALWAVEAPTFSGRGMDEVPAGELQRSLEKLSPVARSQALSQLIGLPKADAVSLVVDEAGCIAYVCARGPSISSVKSATAPQAPRAAVDVSPFPASLVRHSKLGSTNIIYLDFDGGVVTGTRWNMGTVTQGDLDPYLTPIQLTWNCKPFDRDSALATYNDAEQTAIVDIWRRVAEDYAPFDVDVTTEAPSSFTRTTAWALITDEKDVAGNNTPNLGVGGIASLDTFGRSDYSFHSPAWVWAGDSGTPISHVAEATSHEVGHNLGLSHDSTNADRDGYYSGHAATAAAPSWGTIMGAPYERDLSQWSQGDYFDANNRLQNDLAIIASKLPVKTDDHANTAVGATSLSLSGVTFSSTGVIERTADVDAFSVIFAGGRFQAQARPFTAVSGTVGGNLDLALTLKAADGTVLATADPVLGLDAELNLFVGTGTYTVLVEPAGKGSPFAPTNPSGYTTYGVLGNYTLTGQVTPGAALISTPWSPLQFGPLLSGATTTRDLTISNGGSTALRLNSFLITFNPAFTLLTALPATPLTLNPGGSFTLTVQFAPVNAGAFTGTVTAVSDVGGTLVVRLRGEATAALVSSPLSPVSCGAVLAGETTTRDITLSNSGAIPLSLTSFTTSFHPTLTLLTAAPVPPQTLAPGASIVCTVQFSPVAAGAFSGSLSAGSDVGGSITVSISGVGTVPAPPAAASSSGSGGGGSGGCGAGTGIGAILALLAVRLLSQRLARSVR